VEEAGAQVKKGAERDEVHRGRSQALARRRRVPTHAIDGAP
jgi:hypothetical protein